MLFNASSNRLEPTHPRQQLPPNLQPTRVIPRPTEQSSEPLGGSTILTSGPSSKSKSKIESTEASATQASNQSTLPPRPVWSSVPRPDPIDLRVDPVEQENALPRAPVPLPASSKNGLPPRPTPIAQEIPAPPPGLAQRASPAIPTVAPISAPPVPAETPVADSQTAEMHTAAEKARLRREAEETEREAGRERARRKAAELAARFGDSIQAAKPTEAPAPKTSTTILGPPPGSKQFTAQPPMYTIQQRPKPHDEITVTSALKSPAVLPPRPTGDPQPDSWRRDQASFTSAEVSGFRSRPTAESFFESSPAEASTAVSLAARENVLPVPQVAPVSSTLPATPGKAEEVQTVPAMTSPERIKKETFDNMLARIQAAMVEARHVSIPTTPKAESADPPASKLELPESLNSRAPEKSIQPSRPSDLTSPLANQLPSPMKPIASAAPSTILSRPAPKPSHEYFNVTQADRPVSPQPVWRTYGNYPVKMPQDLTKRSPPVPGSSGEPRQPPTGWISSFEPPLDLPTHRTVVDMLLSPSAPNVKSFIVVDVKRDRLYPLSKKAKKRPSIDHDKSHDPSIPPPTHDNLLPASKMLRDRSSKAGHAKQPSESRRRDASPVKSINTGKAEPLSTQPSVPPPNLASQKRLEARPGVRFMVSSELEGDSLLQEVNKMSLETMGEGDKDAEAEGARTSGSNVSDSDFRSKIADVADTKDPHVAHSHLVTRAYWLSQRAVVCDCPA